MSDTTALQDAPIRCFHTTAGLEQRLDLLLHLVEFGQQAVLLTGPEGAGKTALLAELLERAPANWAVAVLDGEVAATVEEVALRLAEAWDLGIATDADDSGTDPVRALGAALAGWARRGRVPLVVIDDADRANDALLVSTLNVVSRVEGRARPRLLLAGEPALEDRLQATPLRDLLTGLPHSLEMPPIEEGEVPAYLAARQEADGLAGVRLPLDAVRRLHRETAGLPGPLYDRFVRAVAAVAAAEAEPARRLAAAPALGAPQARKYALVMGLVALVFVGSLLVRGLVWRETREAGEEAGSVIETLTLPPLDRAAPPPPTVVFPGQTGDAEADPADPRTAAGPATPFPPGAGVSRESRPGGTDAAGSGTGNAGPSPVTAGAGVADAGEAESAAAASPAADSAATAAARPNGQAAPAREEPAVAGSRNGAEEAPPPEEEEEEEAPPAVPAAPPAPATLPRAEAPVPDPPPARAPPVAGEGAEGDLAWLGSLRASDWVLQVFATDNPKAARDALARYGIGGRARVVPTTRDGAAWYVVVMGPWPDRASASAALAGLPKSLRAQGPFPKRVGELQKASQRPR